MSCLFTWTYNLYFRRPTGGACATFGFDFCVKFLCLYSKRSNPVILVILIGSHNEVSI